MIRYRQWLIVAFAFFLTPGTSISQNQGNSKTMPMSAPLKSLADSLRSRGIALSHSSLVDALANADPAVRGLAASKLAEDHDAGAVPAIRDALAAEKDHRTQLNMAMALNALGDASGPDYLRSACDDVTLHAYEVFEIVSAMQLMGLPTKDCSGAILHFLSRPTDGGTRAALVSVLPAMYPELPPSQAKSMLHLIEGFVLDIGQETAVRLQAGHALARIGDPSSATALARAISLEVNPDVQSSFKGDLNSLNMKR